MTDLLNRKLSRRALLRVGGCAGATLVACGVGGVVVGTQTDLIDRIRGISDTPRLANDAAWDYSDNTLTLALDLIPELDEPGSGVRLEEDALPEPLLILHGVDGSYYVYINKCPHAGRKLDPAGGKVECTSVSRSTFDYDGRVRSGPAEDDLTSYAVAVEGSQLVITLA